MKLKQLLLILAVSATTAVSSVWIYGKFSSHPVKYSQATANGKLPANYAGFYDNIATNNGEPIDFTKAASIAVPAVVHIKTKIPAKKNK